MSDGLKRMTCNTVTEALISATEDAEQMSHVIIIYEGPEGDPGGIIVDERLDLKTANFMIDQAKNYLWGKRHA